MTTKLARRNEGLLEYFVKLSLLIIEEADFGTSTGVGVECQVHSVGTVCAE